MQRFIYCAFSVGLSFWCVQPVVAHSLVKQQEPPSVVPSASDSESKIPVTATRVSIPSVIPGVLDDQDSLVDGRYVSAFRFSGSQGDPIQVRLTGSNDTRPAYNLAMQPYLILYGPGNQVLARTGAAPNSIDAFIRLKLPETGDYTAVVTTVEEQKAGRFWFLVQPIAWNSARSLEGIQTSTSEVPSDQALPLQTNQPTNSARP